MSIQNNLDIIVNSQKQTELKLSSDQNLSSKKTVSYNFEELLKTTQEESKVKEMNAETSKKIDENAEVKPTEDVKKSEKTKESEKSEESEKTEAKAETKKSEKTEKSTKSEKRDETEKTVKAAEVRGENFVAENAKSVVKSSENKAKLSDKDFSKLDQIIKNADVGTAEVFVEDQKLTKNLKSAAVEKTDKSESKNVKLSSDVLENASHKSEITFAQNLEMHSDNSEGENELNFADKHSDSKKISKLDKDGKITIQDERTKAPVEEKKVSDKADSKAKTEVKITGENTATITMDMAKNTETNVLALNDQTAASNSSNYQAMFANQLQEAAPDFVKAGQIILKDNNQGTINLVLHPDDMGNVKIHLSLDGKSVSAQITVATKEAMQIFKDNAETLREAFIKQGFENASFDVSYGNSNGGLGQNSEFGGQNDGRELYANRTYNQYAAVEDSGFVDFTENTLNSGNYSVNIVA